MKILGGEYRGRNFYMPGRIRPTQNLTRKALFDIIGQDMTGMTFLDLFAGSGAVGLEALSRGAARVVFVEHDPRCVDVIEENLALLGLKEDVGPGSRWEILLLDAFASIKELFRRGKRFEVVFLDPPYGPELARKTLKTLSGYDILQPNSFIVVEHSKDETLSLKQESFSLIRHRKYGKSFLAIYQKT